MMYEQIEYLDFLFDWHLIFRPKIKKQKKRKSISG